MYTTLKTKRFLSNPQSNPITVEYLMLGLSRGPCEGVDILLDEVDHAIGEDKSLIRKALDLLIANNHEIFPYTKREFA